MLSSKYSTACDGSAPNCFRQNYPLSRPPVEKGAMGRERGNVFPSVWKVGQCLLNDGARARDSANDPRPWSDDDDYPREYQVSMREIGRIKG